MSDLHFDPDTHAYTRGGIVIPHVTGVIGWMNNFIGIPEDVMDKARERGEAVHLMTAMFDLGELDETSVPDEIAGYLDAWKLFRMETNFRPHTVEAMVESRKYRYAGTLDRAGDIQRGPALLDIKATAALPPSAGPQTAAYLQAAVEGNPDYYKRARRFSVQLRADGTYRLQEHKDKADLSVFLASLTCFLWRSKWKM